MMLYDGSESVFHLQACQFRLLMVFQQNLCLARIISLHPRL